MWRLLSLLARGLCAFVLLWLSWFARARTSTTPQQAMSRRVGIAQYVCISHGCHLWTGRELNREELQALSIAHALQHNNRAITPADLFGEQENPE